MRLRTVFLVGLGLLIIWFLYLQREILTPFILAAIFAYIFNPVVNFLSKGVKIPRILSVILIYGLIIGLLVSFGLAVGRRAADESSQLQSFVKTVTRTSQQEVKNLPPYVSPIAAEAISSIRQSKFFEPAFIFTLFPQAISGIIGFIIFLFSGFLFLKEGRSIVDKFLNFLPGEYRVETEILIRRINSVLGAYLRGQLLLVFLVSIVYYIGLTLLGVKFALILAIFSGLAEIVPIIGPIASGAVAALIAFLGGSTSSFGLSPLHTSGAVILLYFATNQIQEYLIKPYVLGKITKLHPLLILFSVIAGGKLGGALGLILAVPIAATVRILLEFSMDIISSSERRK
jgi:predicted PurR-regulated permease PerM